MTINAELEAEILRLYHVENWKKCTIATQLRVHHSVVSRVVAQDGKAPVARRRVRKTDPYLPFIEEQIGRYPRLTAARLLDMVRERGFNGQQSQFRAVIAELRCHAARPFEPFARLSTLPGEQAQVDWGHFGTLQIGRAERPLMAFVLVLAYSRAIYLRFFLSQNLSNFMYGHQFAFAHFGGVVRTCLYDNLRAVVIERIGKAIRFNRQFMALVAHYRFEPRPVGIARGSEKGRVERSIRYIRENFFAARRFKDLDDLNRQALAWCQSNALERRWPDDDKRSVGEMLQEEKAKLLPLPPTEYPCEDRCEVLLDKTPYARFDLNDYSVPAQYVRKALTVVASLDTVRILDGTQVIATHQRCYDRHQPVECRAHTDEITQFKSDAAQHSHTNTLTKTAPSSKQLLGILAERGLPLGRASAELAELLHTYGAAALEVAIQEALKGSAVHPHGVRQILERMRHETATTVPLPLTLPDDPRVRGMAFAPQTLAVYDRLQNQDKPTEEN